MKRFTAHSFCILVIYFIGWFQSSYAQNWTRFRGPNGTGIVKGENVPVKLSKDNILWKVNLPGVGHSSPIVWKDRIFIQATSEDSKKRYLACVDANGGKVLWTHEEGGEYRRTHKWNSLASSTPATDGERVYAYFWDGREVSITAFNFAGKPLWNRSLGAFQGRHGAGTSPIVYNGKVIVNHDIDGSSAVVALDAKSGKVVWKTPRRACEDMSYSIPFLLKTDKGNELIVGSTAGITSLNPDSGKIIWNFNWKFPGKPLRTVGGPTYSNGMIIHTSGNGGGRRHAIAVKTGGKGDVTDSHLVWQSRQEYFPYVPCMLAVGDYLYIVHDKGILSCVEAKTGKSVWKKRLVASEMFSSPVMINDFVYTCSETGKVLVFTIKPDYKLISEFELSATDRIMATPAVANDCLYIRSAKSLYCLGKK